MKKLLGFVVGIIVVALGCAGASSVHAAVDSMNYVNVSSCEQVGNDIRVSLNNGAKYFLTSSCRDAGYGMRNYTMSCVSQTQYKVSWAETSTCTNSNTTSPTITLTSNKSTVNDNETVTLTASASDTRKVTKIEIYEGGTLRKTCTNENSCSYSFVADADQNSDRTQTFSARAYDAAGNVKNSNSIAIRTRVPDDSVKPRVSFSANKTNVKTGEKVIFATSAYDRSGISKIEIHRIEKNGVREDTVVYTCRNTTSCLYTTTFTAGTYDFMAYATDDSGNTVSANRNGNVGTSVIVRVIVDNAYTLSASLKKTNYPAAAGEGTSWSEILASAVSSLGIKKIELYTSKNGTDTFILQCRFSTGLTRQCGFSRTEDELKLLYPFSVYARVTDKLGHVFTSEKKVFSY